MKKRIISSVVGICILMLVLFFYKTVVLNIAITIITLMVTFELLLAKKYFKYGWLTLICLVFSLFVSFLSSVYYYRFLVPICVVFAFLLFVVMLYQYPKIRFEAVTTSFFISVVVSIIFQMLISIRDKYSYRPQVALFYIILSLASAWLTDSGAYFIGVFFGKTKLASEISPKKTIEGLLGGILSSAFLCFIIFLCFSYVFSKEGLQVSVNYLELISVLIIASALSVIGDLSASLIKRQCNIKDFGSIMPGHGGVLDRFDSVIFTIPFYYLIDMFLPLVK